MGKQTLEELKADRDSLKDILAKVEIKIDRLELPAIRAEFEKQYVNTYWKHHNGYGQGKEWFSYAHVKGITDVWKMMNGYTCKVICDIIEKRSGNEIVFRISSAEYSLSTICVTKITKAVFDKKKAALVKEVKDL